MPNLASVQIFNGIFNFQMKSSIKQTALYVFGLREEHILREGSFNKTKMSATRGDCQRKRAQKHQNKTTFKNDLYDKSDRIKALNSMSINEVCQRCHDTIQWKIKYRKYKALTQPGACNICHERKVKKGE